MSNHPLCHLLAVLSVLFFSAAAQAQCECLWEGSFVDVQADTALVVSASVLSGKGNSIDVQVDQILRGKTNSQELRVWLKAAHYCRPEPSTFPLGSQWVMALHQIKKDIPGAFNPHTPNISYGRKGDYILSSCGGYWLSRHGDWVTGNLAKAPRWVRDPKMTPVLLELIAAFVAGEINADVLVKASQEDPALRELMLDTKAFLRKK